jgi:hypothetical protein
VSVGPLAIVAAVAAFHPSPTSAAEIKGSIQSVGFASNNGWVFRFGHWTPIVVTLTSDEGPPVNAVISVGQSDLDGDKVIYKSQKIVVQPKAVRQSWLACIPNETGRESIFDVRIIDPESGELLGPVISPPGNLEKIDDNMLLMVNLSEHSLELLRDFRSDNDSMLGGAVSGLPKYLQPIQTARMEPKNLPDKWWALESVDYFVWSEPDPLKIDPSQLGALIEWVRRGGTIVLAVGRQWDEVMQSRLAELLPGKFVGDRAVPAEDQAGNISVARAIFESDENAERVYTDRYSEAPTAYRAAFGQGMVVLFPSDLRFHAGWSNCRLEDYDRLLHLERKPKNPDLDLGNFPNERKLAADFRKNIDFTATGQSYMALGILFIVVYGLFSTLGTWAWLRRKNLSHHSYTVMLVCAAAATAISMAGVGVARGVITKVNSVAVVDGRLGDPTVDARLYYGLRIPRRTDVNVSIGGAEYLRPLSALGEVKPYAVPSRYELDLSSGTMQDVPIRATLKQVDACWSGLLPGGGVLIGEIKTLTVTGSMEELPGSSPRIQGKLINKLGIDLQDCYLIRPIDEWKSPDKRIPKHPERHPFLIHHIGDFDKEKEWDTALETVKPSGLTEWLHAEVLTRRFGRGEIPTPRSRARQALLLLAVNSAYDPDWGKKLLKKGGNLTNPSLGVDLGRDLERLRRLGSRHALFVGFSLHPPLVNLEVGNRPVRGETALTMYRIAVPLKAYSLDSESEGASPE